MTQTQNSKCRVCQDAMNPYPMGQKNDWKLAACRSCGSVMADPWPTPAQLEQFYADVQPEITHAPDPNAEIVKYKRRIKKLLSAHEGKTFIDVVSRQGYGVQAAKQLGMRAQGIDSLEFYYKFAKEKYPGDTFTHASPFEFTKTGFQADVVFAVYAFAEGLDPDATAAALAKLVAPGGLIFIEEPDGNGFNVPKNFANWDFVEPPFNFLYLSKKGIGKLLARHGLAIEKSFFVWPPYMRLVVKKK